MRPIAAHWVVGRDLTDPTVSPLYGDLTRLPPTLVLVGSRDICRPDCDRLVELAPASADLTLHVEDGLVTGLYYVRNPSKLSGVTEQVHLER